MKDIKSVIDEGNFLTIRDFKNAFSYFISGNSNIYILLQNNFKEELSWHDFVFKSEFYKVKMDLVKDAIVNCSIHRYKKEKTKKEVTDIINFDYDFNLNKIIKYNYLKTIFSCIDEVFTFNTDEGVKFMNK